MSADVYDFEQGVDPATFGFTGASEVEKLQTQ